MTAVVMVMMMLIRNATLVAFLLPSLFLSCVRKTLPGSFYAGEQNLEWRERSFEERNGAVDKICIIMHK